VKKVLSIIVLVVGIFLATTSGVLADDPPDLKVDIGVSGEDVEVNLGIDANTSTVNVDGGDNSQFNINGSNLDALLTPRGDNTLNEWVHQNMRALWEYAQRSNVQLVLVSDALAYKIQNDEAYFNGTLGEVEDLNYRLVSVEDTLQALNYAPEISQLEARLLVLEGEYKSLQVENVLLQAKVAYLDSQQPEAVVLEAVMPELPVEQSNGHKVALGLGIGIPALSAIVISVRLALKRKK
jgi:hypothetical protein